MARKTESMKTLRKARAWTQAQLAEAAECGVATIIRAEAKSTWPSNPSVRKAVQAALGMHT